MTYLSHLNLQHFRNFESLDLILDRTRPLTVIFGKNAQGKSNLLESIYFLSITKSFRENELANLVQWDRPYTRIRAMLENNNEKHQFEFFYQKTPTPKRYFQINNQPKKLDEYWGSFTTVLFSPEEINQFFSRPTDRRRYLDRFIAQIDKSYLKTLTSYQKVLRHKRALLKQINLEISSPSEIDFWNQKIAELGSQILAARLQTISQYNQYLSQNYQNIASENVTINLDYQSNTSLPISQTEASDLIESYYNSLLTTLQAKKNSEIHAARSLIGPHLDDLLLTLNGRKSRSFASRGEQRSLILSLKLAEIALIEKKIGIKPLLLFDDIFSELDSDRRRQIVGLIRTHQSLITTLSLDEIRAYPEAQIFQIEQGRVV